MGKRIRVGKGRSAVYIDGPLAEGLDAEVRSLLGPVADRLQAEADRILDEARHQWPVKTGASRDSWDTVLTIIPGTFEVEVSMISDDPATRYIKSTKVGKERDATRVRSPLQEHIRKPARASKKSLKKELPTLLAKHLGEVFSG